MASKWSCSECTFVHHFPGTRCCMCQHPRVSAEDMKNFIQGVPVPVDRGPSLPPLADKVIEPLVKPKASLRRPAAISIFNPYSKQRKLSPEDNGTATTSADPSPTKPNKPILQSNGKEEVKILQPSPPQRSDSVSNATSSTKTIQEAWTTTATTTTSTIPASNRSSHMLLAEKKRQNPQLQYKPGPVSIDTELSKEWIFPMDPNYEKREYQFDICHTAIRYNTLVSLPTGLGKTLIAAVVMHNFHRWFPGGKIIFMAPTLPLVNQQVEACYHIVKIPPKNTALLTGKTHAARRQVVWRERAVFFCTPQTVQKDLEQGRLPASQVVCVVLDEAHKASGDYAYVKVIEQLEQAGAHFRVLGLSATPGTNIKAIQQVIDALRISRIEARHESDPSVAKYVHGRATEVVIVEQASACLRVERCINDILGPMLSKLKPVSPRLLGNATLTAFQVMKARELYQAQHTGGGSPPLLPHFFAVQTFVQLRHDLLHQGIGLVRNKVHQLKAQPQRGLLSTIVKSWPEFERLYQEVMVASFDPDSKEASIQDRLVNNPKLAKLREILMEHFRRAELNGESSRAIVFSQFRDSVQEIVGILNEARPMIRPRHFIGQGNGSNSNTGQLKGMKQKEQHEAIREFRDDVYNVLVCTCIGEEGLDIGEVDLIVNYDTLRSPIRMIQRVGRTGRKRSGRVVCLIAQGAEERTWKESQNSEKTLMRSLQNQNSFKVVPSPSLFPVLPSVKEEVIESSQSFRISQVEGHADARSKSAITNESRAPKTRWRLEDSERSKLTIRLGLIKALDVPSTSDLAQSMKRRLLVGRSYRFSSSLRNQSVSGAISSLLRTIDSKFNTVPPEELLSRALPRSKPSNIVHQLFPLGPSTKTRAKQAVRCDHVSNPKEVTMKNAYDKAKHANKSPVNNRNSTLEAPQQSSSQEQKRLRPVNLNKMKTEQKDHDAFIRPHVSATSSMPAPIFNPYATTVCSTRNLHTSNMKLTASTSSDITSKESQCAHVDPNSTTQVLSTSPHAQPPALPAVLIKANMQPHEREAHVRSSYDSGSNQSMPPPLPINPYSKSIMTFNPQPESNATSISSKSGPPSNHGIDLIKSRSVLPEVDDMSMADLEYSGVEDNILAMKSQDDTDDFVLPPIDDDSDEEDSQALKQLNQPAIEIDAVKQFDADDEFLLPPVDEDSDSDCTMDEEGNTGTSADQVVVETFRLPSQEDDSSSDESSIHHETPSHQEIDDQVTECHNVSTVYKSESPLAESVPANQYRRLRKALMDTPEDPGSQSACSLVSTIRSSIRPGHNRRVLLDDSPLSRAPGRKSLGSVEGALQDTQPSDSDATPLNDKIKIRHRTNFPAEDDIDTASIVCAVCHSGNSPDYDPIFLCDGVPNQSCDAAVHMTCYSIPHAFLDLEREWRCDVCVARYSGSTGSLFCSDCGQSHSRYHPLKQLSSFEWMHLACPDHRIATNKAVPCSKVNKSKILKPSARANVYDAGHRSIPSTTTTKESAVMRQENRKNHFFAKRRQYRHFLDEEAAIDSDEDMLGDVEEEDEIAAIEEEEAFYNSFINDSSQLGFEEEDDLDRCDADDALHRAVDAERIRANAFATPLLNRRMKRQHAGNYSGTPASAPDSERGLGNMHFIRSVIEHHKNGGAAEDIERVVQELEADASEVDEDDLIPERPRRCVVQYLADSSDDDNE